MDCPWPGNKAASSKRAAQSGFRQLNSFRQCRWSVVAVSVAISLLMQANRTKSNENEIEIKITFGMCVAMEPLNQAHQEEPLAIVRNHGSYISETRPRDPDPLDALRRLFACLFSISTSNRNMRKWRNIVAAKVSLHRRFLDRSWP